MDTIALKATPKVNRLKGSQVQVGDVVVMWDNGTGVWVEVTKITVETYMSKKNYRLHGENGLSELKAGNEYIQVHS